jgi:amino acid transporter
MASENRLTSVPLRPRGADTSLNADADARRYPCTGAAAHETDARTETEQQNQHTPARRKHLKSVVLTLTPVVAIGPNIMAVFGGPADNKWDNVALGTAVAFAMLIISVAGIRLSARTQVTIGIIEYAILIVISVSGLIFILSRHAGTFRVTGSWFTLHGIDGKGSLAAGFLIAVFMYSGWDGTLS